MAQNGHTKGAETDGRAPRAGSLRHTLLSRALPGSIVAVAALTIPEFSAGAGDIDGGKHSARSPEPGVRHHQDVGKTLPDAAKAPLAGVRYGGMLAIREASQSPSARLARDVVTVKPHQPAAETAALAVVPTISKAAPLGGIAHSSPVSSGPLDDAASYAATALDRMATQPGALAADLPEAETITLAKPAAIDVAASYAAMALDSFADEAPSELQLVAEWAPQPELLTGPVTPNADEIVPTLPDIAAEGAIALPEHGAQAIVAPVREPAGSLITTPVAAAVPRDALPHAAEPVPSVLAPIAPAQAYAPMEAAPHIALAAAPAPSATPALVAAPAPWAAPGAGLSALAETVDEAEAPLAFDLRSQLVARVDGKAAGTIDFRQTATGLSVRLGSIVSLLSDRYDADDVARIANSAASRVYIPLAELQAQGIPISYDPVYDEFNIGQAGARSEGNRSVAVVANGQARP